MKLNDVIRTRRQALGLTQEALADKVGVSAPAVNKWEKGLNYPDITLLPTLARTLGVDLNTLLSFQEDMTREEIGLFLNQITAEARTKGCGAAVQMVRDKLWEFPNNDQLAYSAAGVLEGVLALYPQGGEEERTVWQREISALYERSVRSSDPKVREWATYTLAARSMKEHALDRAEALLDQLSDTHRDKRLLAASLREAQGRREEAWVLLERELFDRTHGIQTVLLQMVNLALEEQDTAAARHLTKTGTNTAQALELPDYAGTSVALHLALMEQDAPQALELLDRLLSSMTKPVDLNSSPLYRHISVKTEAEQTQVTLLQAFLDQMDTNPEVQFLKELPDYQNMMKKYRDRSEEKTT